MGAIEDLIRDQEAFKSRIMSSIVAEVPVYITGTYTPTLVGSTIAGTFTYTTQNGRYTRIGNVVFVTAHIGISAITVAPTGNLQLGGLPITSSTPDPGTFNLSDYSGFTLGAGYSQLGARMQASNTKALLIKSGSAIQALVLAGGALALVAGVAEIVYSGGYTVA